jgi:AcrR family transcriptional regulator
MTTASVSKNLYKILGTARDLFWKHGFKRISIEEICRTSDISKMTFYRYFPNKIELAKAVFDREVDEGLEKFRQILHGGGSSSEKIKQILQMKIAGSNHISKEFLQDFYSNRELGLKEHIEEKTRQSWNAIMMDFKAAQDEGWIRKDLKPEFLFYFSQRMGDLVTDEKLLSLYSTPQEFIIELSNFFAYGISPRDETK